MQKKNIVSSPIRSGFYNYLRKWPGLLECGRNNAGILALYAPQLTIRGFDDGLADVFDELLKTSYEDSLHFFSYSDPDTVDGKPPLCGEAIAWRHHNLGNYTDGELASLLFMRIQAVTVA